MIYIILTYVCLFMVIIAQALTIKSRDQVIETLEGIIDTQNCTNDELQDICNRYLDD